MPEKLPEEKREEAYEITLKDQAWRRGPVFRPLSRLERLKFSLMTLFGLTVFLAVIISAFFIGLILAIPLTVIWMIWLGRIAWRLRTRSRLNRF
jgi:Flp pilus assembly protein TadB